MVRKINVVDLNEIKSVPTTVANHIEKEEEEPTQNPEEVPTVVEEPLKGLASSTETTEPEPLKGLASSTEPKLKKCDEKATCAFCNKIMSVKALRYSHDKNCKGRRPEPVPVPEPRAVTPPAVKVIAPVFEMPQVINTRTRQSKAEIKQQRLNNLVSQAF